MIDLSWTNWISLVGGGFFGYAVVFLWQRYRAKRRRQRIIDAYFRDLPVYAHVRPDMDLETLTDADYQQWLKEQERTLP